METFEEYIKNTDKGQSIETLKEGFLNHVRAEILLIGKKVDELEAKILTENDIARKIDLLAKQNKWSSFLSICMLAIKLKDISILRKVVKR